MDRQSLPSKHLRQHLFKHGYTVAEIADFYGLAKRTVRRWRQNIGAPRLKESQKRFTEDDYDLWYRLRFEEGMDNATIAKKWECSTQHIRKQTNKMREMGYGEAD